MNKLLSNFNDIIQLFFNSTLKIKAITSRKEIIMNYYEH